MPAARPTKKPARGRSSRVDALRAIDRYTTGRGGAPQSQARPGTLPGTSAPVAGRPQRRPVPGQPQVSRPFGPPGGGGGQPQVSQPFTPPDAHPFIPGGSIAPVVPANVSESGSPPGTPNLAAMVARSFQPSVMERTPLVSAGAGVPPNAAYNFGGANTAPPGTRSMVPQRGVPQGTF